VDTYTFGPFCLDPSERILRRGGERVPLPAKPFDILVLLLSRPGRAVRKEEFLETVWPDVVVSESNLKQNVLALRKALEEAGGDPTWIETVPKLGYRWLGPATPEETAAAAPAPEARADVPGARPAAGRGVAVAGLAVAAAATLLVVSSVLLARLDPRTGVEDPLAARPPEAATARFLTVRGRYHWSSRTNSGLQQSLALFERALRLDPSYAPAHAGLADACAFDLSRRGEAEEHARKALALDPSLARPHATLGFLAMFRDWDWPRARRSLEKAVELDPDDVSAHQWLALWHALNGEAREASRRIERARQVDPVSLPALADRVELAYLAGQEERALEHAREALELDPDFLNVHLTLMKLHARAGRFDEWVASRRKVDALTGADLERRRRTDERFDQGGFRQVLEGDRYRLLSARGADPYALAEIGAWLGERDETVRRLEEAVEGRSFHVVYIGVDPLYTFLRDDVRFQRLVARVGLPAGPG
jgi:DNA-binding winged helix-turn-helix (wHTH) protein/Tfp pilus assembly protein PilF